MRSEFRRWHAGAPLRLATIFVSPVSSVELCCCSDGATQRTLCPGFRATSAHFVIGADTYGLVSVVITPVPLRVVLNWRPTLCGDWLGMLR